MNLRLSAILAVMFCCVARLSAQGTAQQVPDVRMDLMPVCLGGDMVVYYATTGKVNKLEAYESSMGTPVFYKGPVLLRVYATEADAAPRKADEAPVMPLASASLPTGARRALLLFVRTPDKKVSLRAYPVDDKSLAAGDYRIFNLSKIHIIGLMGKRHLDMKPGQIMDVSETSMRERDVDLEVQFGCVNQGRQDRFYSSVWGHSAKSRSYVFMVGTGNEESPVTLRKFHDIPSVQSIGYEPEKPSGH